MSANLIESLEKREIGIPEARDSLLLASVLQVESVLIARELAKEEILRKGVAEMAAIRHKKSKLILHRPVQYPLPQGLLTGIREE